MVQIAAPTIVLAEPVAVNGRAQPGFTRRDRHPNHWHGGRSARRRAPAAFLNAEFGPCLGCELYLLLRRWAPQG